ncbi:MAG: TetR family transcriptional regulator [Candidatus Tectomicrobia bacterium]|nr:TetR family transcriptional regulator [Candidatus Tectomicrobia bacterium]
MKTSPTATLSRRDAILHAALELFAQQSFAATPVPMIAERAGVGTGTIYRYWSGKEELVNDLYRFCKRALAAYLDIPPHLSARQTFGAWWQHLLAFAEENPDAFEFLEAHKHQPYLDRKSLALDAKLQAVAVRIIKDWQDQGAISDLEPTALLTLAHGAFVGLRKAMAAGHLNLSDDLITAAEEQVWKLFER